MPLLLALACGGSAPTAATDLDVDGFTTDEGDCDDADPTLRPGALEVCADGMDQDCSGEADEPASACTGDLSCPEGGACADDDCRCTCTDGGRLFWEVQGEDCSEGTCGFNNGGTFRISSDAESDPIACPSQIASLVQAGSLPDEGELTGPLQVHFEFPCVPGDPLALWYIRTLEGLDDRRALSLRVEDADGVELHRFNLFEARLAVYSPLPENCTSTSMATLELRSAE